MRSSRVHVVLVGLILLAPWSVPAQAPPRDGGTGAGVGTPALGDGGAAPSPAPPTGTTAAPEAEIRRDGSWYVLPSGVRYQELRTGKGRSPGPDARVTIHYTGRFKKNGKQFDTSRGKKPWSFVWGKNQVIPGYEIGMAGMRVGGRRKIEIPSSLAYGEKGFKKIIPPSADLVFDVELLGVK